MKRILMVDDQRDARRKTEADFGYPGDFTFEADDQVLIARDYGSAMAVLQALPAFDLLLLDRDLACFEQGQEKTGEDILTWLHQNPDKVPADIKIITANIVRRPAMEASAYQLKQKL